MSPFHRFFAALSVVGFVIPVGLASSALASETVAQSSTGTAPAGAVQRLGQMFSPEIQTVVNACWEQGKVTLAANAQLSAPLMCGNGTAASGITQQSYLETLSDILAASSLIGFRTVMQSDPRLTPEVLRTFVADPQGLGVLQNTIQTAIAQSQLIAPSASGSADLLTQAVVGRLVPVLQDSSGLTNLLGTPQQYQQVVSTFCTAPGMSVEQAKSQLPGLNSLQLFAICIQESGVTREVLPQGNGAQRREQNNRQGGGSTR